MVKLLKVFFWCIFITLPELIFLSLFYILYAAFCFLRFLICLPINVLFFFSKCASTFSKFLKYFITSYALVWPAPARACFSRIALVLTFPLDFFSSSLIWCGWILKTLFLTLFFLIKIAIFSIIVAPLLYSMYLLQLLWMWLLFLYYSALLAIFNLSGFLLRAIILLISFYKSVALVRSKFVGFQWPNLRVLVSFILNDLNRQQFGSLVIDKVDNFRAESRVLNLTSYHVVGVPRSAYYPFALRMGRYHQFLSRSGPFSPSVRAATDLDLLRWYKVLAPLSADKIYSRLGRAEISLDSLYYPNFFSDAERYLESISSLRHSLLLGTLTFVPFSAFSTRYVNLLFCNSGQYVRWFEGEYNFVLLDPVFSYNSYDFLSPNVQNFTYWFNRRPGTSRFYGLTLEGYGDSNFYNISKPKQLSGVESMFFLDDLDHYDRGHRISPLDRFWFKRFLNHPSINPLSMPLSSEEDNTTGYKSTFLDYFVLLKHNLMWTPSTRFGFLWLFKCLLYYFMRISFYLTFILRMNLESYSRTSIVLWNEIFGELFRLFIYIPIYVVGLRQRACCCFYKLKAAFRRILEDCSLWFSFVLGQLLHVPFCDLIHGKFISVFNSILRYGRNKLFELRRSIFSNI